MENNITFIRKEGFYYQLDLNLQEHVNVKSIWNNYLNILAHSKSIRDAVYNNGCLTNMSKLDMSNNGWFLFI
jgi:hypothetical protein